MDFNTSVAPPIREGYAIPGPVSQSPLEIVAGLQQFRAQQQQMAAQQQAMQTHALQQQELQMELDKRKAVNAAYQSAFEPQANGVMRLNPDKLTQGLAQSGHGEAIPGILEGVTKYQTSMVDLNKKKSEVAALEQDAAGNLGATAKAAKYDPLLFHTLMTDAVNAGVLNKEHYAPIDQQVQQALAQDPSGETARQLFSQIADQFIAGSPKQQELITEGRTAAARETSVRTGEQRLT